MPVLKKPLHNTPPPTWTNPDGVTAPPDGSVVDTTTSLRWIVGEDFMNYHTSQRYQGDLFYRDIRLDDQMNGVIDFLGERTGLTFNQPATELLPGKHVCLGQFTVVTEPNMYVVALEAKVVDTTEAQDVVINVVDRDKDYRKTITNVALTSNVVTLTLNNATSLVIGDVMMVACSNTTVSGLRTLTNVSGSTVQFALTSANIASVAATGKCDRVLAGAISQQGIVYFDRARVIPIGTKVEIRVMNLSASTAYNVSAMAVMQSKTF